MGSALRKWIIRYERAYVGVGPAAVLKQRDIIHQTEMGTWWEDNYDHANAKLWSPIQKVERATGGRPGCFSGSSRIEILSILRKSWIGGGRAILSHKQPKKKKG